MIAVLASILFAAFPVRGSLLQTLDSAFVLDRDTVRIDYEPCTCTCPSGSYRLAFSKDSTTGVQRFPGTDHVLGALVFEKSSGQYQGMDASGMFPICSTTQTIPPSDSRRFLLRGVSGVWAVWADSVFAWTSTIRTFDTSNGVVSGTTRQKKTFKARWRWSRIDTAIPWVRWVDTIPLLDGAAPVGLPVLTTRIPATPGYLAPQSAMANLGLVLRDARDSATPIDWGYRGRPLPAATMLPAGRTLRVLDAYNPHGGAIRWDLTATGSSRDEVLMVGARTAETLPTRRSEPARRGAVGYEISTGRRFRLEAPRPVGLQLVRAQEGMHLVLVE